MRLGFCETTTTEPGSVQGHHVEAPQKILVELSGFPTAVQGGAICSPLALMVLCQQGKGSGLRVTFACRLKGLSVSGWAEGDSRRPGPQMLLRSVQFAVELGLQL